MRAWQVGAVAVLLVGAALAGAGAFGHGPAAELVGGRCALGYVGHAVTMEVRGTGARELCASQTTVGEPWYLLGPDDPAPAGALICRLTRDDLAFTIRDSGQALIGSAYCDLLTGD